jgi:nitrite reductase/ring-hydroxylating ferredoxin subunit
MNPSDKPETPTDTAPAAACCGCQAGEPKEKSSRRNFLLQVGLALNVIAGAMISLPIIGFALSSFFKKTAMQWVSLGPISNFPEHRTQLATFQSPNTSSWDGVTGHLPCWVRRVEGEEFQIFAINCTHLGCPVRWFQESKLFMCPCHGGAFYQDGSHASGPPPRGLYEYKYKVENGDLMILAGQLPTLATGEA